jgi:F-type H+-transporting ATPase subunit gamma
MRAIRQTLQVTKAMNLISTAKLRKGRRVLEDTEPFFTRIQKSMFDILSGAGGKGMDTGGKGMDAGRVESDFFRGTGAGGKGNDAGGRGTDAGGKGNDAGGKGNDAGGRSRSAVVVITSDKGLAGGYNANICRQASSLCERLNNPILILIGSIGYRYFIHSPLLILENFSFRSQMPTVENAKEIADYIVSQFLWGMFDEVHVVYTHMYSSIKLLPTERHILPLDLERMQAELSRQEGQKRVELQFEYLPSAGKVFDALAPFYIKGIIYGCLVESYVSEQSARMAAMDEASKSAEDMLASLQVNYNRVRQAGITQEMSEIVGGAAALQ